MPDRSEEPTIIAAAGNLPKRVAGYVGRVNSATEAASVARMESPAGWSEPGQTRDLMSTPWYCGATASGNVPIQVMGAGQLAGLGETRALVRRSFALEPARGGLARGVREMPVTA